MLLRKRCVSLEHKYFKKPEIQGNLRNIKKKKNHKEKFSRKNNALSPLF